MKKLLGLSAALLILSFTGCSAAEAETVPTVEKTYTPAPKTEDQKQIERAKERIEAESDAEDAPTNVRRVIDGDTIEMTNGTTVRLIGIDAPEKGECGDEEATVSLEGYTMYGPVTLVKGGTDDKDRYGRLLRYVDQADGTDAGAKLLEYGEAKPRYNSTDGYGPHDREETYEKIYKKKEGPGCWEELAREIDIKYANCDAVRAAGADPIFVGEDGYGRHLDRDGDGVGCE